MFSALKHNGIPLYKYARDGITIERQSREVVIHDIKLDLINANHIAMSVCCSKGTYIRTLAEQLGEDIGSGALLSKLVRTKINNISLSDSISLDEFLSKTINELKDNYIVNVDKLFNDVKSYIVSNEDKFKVQNGNKLKVNHQPCEIIKIYDADKSFLGIGKISDNFELLPKKILV
jgi:tRNA pseudouridine55 synthase